MTVRNIIFGTLLAIVIIVLSFLQFFNWSLVIPTAFIIAVGIFVTLIVAIINRRNSKKNDLDKPPDRRLASILFTDIVGYTVMMGANEQKALNVLKRNREIQKPLIEEHKGKWLKETGDGSLSSFHSASEAVMCAKNILEKIREDGTFSIRIGIHLGEVVILNEDIFGDGVNIASRIMSEAKEGGICISEPVYQNIKNKDQFELQYLGDFDLKNVKDKIKLFGVDLKGEN